MPPVTKVGIFQVKRQTPLLVTVAAAPVEPAAVPLDNPPVLLELDELLAVGQTLNGKSLEAVLALAKEGEPLKFPEATGTPITARAPHGTGREWTWWEAQP